MEGADRTGLMSQASRYNVLLMLALFAGELGLIARSLKSYESKDESPSE